MSSRWRVVTAIAILMTCRKMKAATDTVTVIKKKRRKNRAVMDIHIATKMNKWKKRVVKVRAIAMRPLSKRVVTAIAILKKRKALKRNRATATQKIASL